MRHPRLRPVLVIAVGIVVLIGPATASAAPSPPPAGAGGIGLSLLDDGAAGNDPRARVYIVERLGPGAAVHRRVEVANATTASAHIALYCAAADIERGTFVGAAGRTRNDVSTWTTVGPPVLDLAAGSRAFADVTIRVARDAAPGEYYGVVWAEVRSAPSGTGGVVQVSRVGIRMYLSVGPGAPPAASFTVGSLRAGRSADGHQMVTASVHNTGGRAVDMVGTLQLLAGPGGVRAGPFAVTLGTTVAVGDTQPVTVVLAQRLAAGPWDAQLVLRSGLLERRAHAMITLSDKAKTPSATGDASGSAWLSAGVVGVAGLTSLGAVLVVRRRRRQRHKPSPAADGSDGTRQPLASDHRT